MPMLWAAGLQRPLVFPHPAGPVGGQLDHTSLSRTLASHCFCELLDRTGLCGAPGPATGGWGVLLPHGAQLLLTFCCTFWDESQLLVCASVAWGWMSAPQPLLLGVYLDSDQAATMWDGAGFRAVCGFCDQHLGSSLLCTD
uniref:Uncharacterized protein n=1 Tax=Molossus molossus TaxID=27622 RepID=A0A7J8I984_MOLMO|nr:hypothetical protein HJG59_010575 [Molossus molossus]